MTHLKWPQWGTPWWPSSEGSAFFTAVAQVQSLARELRSHKTCCVASPPLQIAMFLILLPSGGGEGPCPLLLTLDGFCDCFDQWDMVSVFCVGAQTVRNQQLLLPVWEAPTGAMSCYILPIPGLLHRSPHTQGASCGRSLLGPPDQLAESP